MSILVDIRRTFLTGVYNDELNYDGFSPKPSN